MSFNRRQFLTLPLMAATSSGQNTNSSAKKPNVIILLADDLGTSDVAYRGGEIDTPNIDRLAKEGLRLERYYVFPVCSPTRSALMTGRSPMRLGVIYTVIRPWETYGVPVEEHFLPQTFKEAGYETAMTGKWHLGHAKKAFLPNQRGFDHSYGHVNGALDYFEHYRDGGLDWHRDGKALVEKGYTTDLVAKEASRLIRSRDKSKPLFLYVPFNAPHAPLQAPPELMEKYSKRISNEKRRTFAAMVDAMDTAIGQIRKTVQEEGMANDTLFMFFSDNGGPIGQAATNVPLRGGKAQTFEGGIRSPGILHWPGKVPVGESKQIMTVMDVFPTLAAAVGIKTRNRKPFDGKNMWSKLLAGKTEPREDLFFAHGNFHAVFHNEWKLVTQDDKKYLFRHNEDREEKFDLAAKHADVVKDLSARIETWKKLHPVYGVKPSDTAPKDWKVPESYIDAAK